MNSLFDKPTDEQGLLLARICRGLFDSGQWPTFCYVDHMLYREEERLDAKAVVASCPQMKIGASTTATYGWIFADRADINMLQPADKIGLTLAGMRHVAGMFPLVEIFLTLLSDLVVSEEKFLPQPSTTKVPDITAKQIDSRVKYDPDGIFDEQDHLLQVVHTQLQNEPSTWHSVSDFSSPEAIYLLSPLLRDFRDINNIDDYVQRIIDRYTPVQSMQFAHPSSLSLAEAIQFLNVAWYAYDRAWLFKSPRVDLAAQLPLDCASKDEFASRMNALVATIGNPQVAVLQKKTLFEFEQHLVKQIPPEGNTTGVNEAFVVLKAACGLRNALQHGGSDLAKKEWKAQDQLGVRLASGDWNGMWHTVQLRCTAALNVIRQEVEALITERGAT